jgi:hypothetical protein
MGFRFVRIGNVLNWTPTVVKRYPMISYVVMFVIYILFAKFCFEGKDNPTWYNILFFLISGWAYAAIDNQLPTKRYRDLAILLGTFFLLFGSLALKELVIDKNGSNLDSVDLFIIATVTLLPLVYGVYCIWKLRKQKILVADRLQHITQIRNRRKIK